MPRTLIKVYGEQFLGNYDRVIFNEKKMKVSVYCVDAQITMPDFTVQYRNLYGSNIEICSQDKIVRPGSNQYNRIIYALWRLIFINEHLHMYLYENAPDLITILRTMVEEILKHLNGTYFPIVLSFATSL